ncbi:hypothetical protein KVR01_007317 [Diaporthe batatas]|uniref:uncharacterized protein n=1 Tax=Diaporthe batatas TaxID=748121 RepID=UPI001D043DD5|nr:uncharacterized protein KVR01_007317 [Diaporthe batatas]KAG8162839.1 hypothetical protein KVR01_007317 [Diaporthe batatas]
MTRRIHRRWRHMAQAEAPPETPAQKAERARQEQAAAHHKAVMKLAKKVGRQTRGFTQVKITDLWKHIDETTEESLYMPYIRHVFYKVTLRRSRMGGSLKQRRAAVLKKWDRALARFRELADKQQQEKNPKLRELIQTFVSVHISNNIPNIPRNNIPSNNITSDNITSNLTGENYNHAHTDQSQWFGLDGANDHTDDLTGEDYDHADTDQSWLFGFDGTDDEYRPSDEEDTPVSTSHAKLPIMPSPSKAKPSGDEPDTDSEPAHVHEDDEPSASASWTDPLHGVAANLSADGEDAGSDRTATKPFDFRRGPLDHSAALIQQRAIEGRIKIGLGLETEQAVDRLYPGARQLRHEDLDTLSPGHTDSDHVASLHNLYVDLCRRMWVETDGLIHGMLLSLFGRDDVYIPYLELQVNEHTNPGQYEDDHFPQEGRERRYHVLPVNTGNNHFVVVIGDRQENRACFFDGYHQGDPIQRDEVLRRVKEHYEAFLGLIGAPRIELRYGRAPDQPDDVSSGLIALEVVRYVFRELGGDLATAEEQDFILTNAVTRTVGREPWAGGSDEELIGVLLQAWLLWIERELGGDGSRRALAGELLDADEPRGTARPCVYKKGVRLSEGHLPTSDTQFFAAFPKDMVERWTSLCRRNPHFADMALVTAGLATAEENVKRHEDFSHAYKGRYGQHDVQSLGQDDRHADLPSQHVFDDLTGLPLADRGPYSMAPDANLQYVVCKDGGETTYARHADNNLTAIATCTNWLKGSQFTNQDLAAAALLLRRLHDLDTPWPQRKQEVQFALNCLDNLAGARLVDACRSNDHRFENRCQVWKGQGEDDLKASDYFWARPEGDNEYMTTLVEERMSQEKVTQRAGVFFSLGLERWLGTTDRAFARGKERRGEYEGLQEEMWAVADGKGLTRREFEFFFLLHGVYFPFHISARKYLLRKEHWTIAHLVALARDEVEGGLRYCNKAAIAKGLGEDDLYKAENWARVIFPMFLSALDKLIEVKKELRDRWQSKKWPPPGPGVWDDVFMDEAAHLLTDDLGVPILPFQYHILRCTHEKRFDPQDIMLSGYEVGPNGMPFDSAGPFTHPEPFHLMRSFVPWARTMMFSSYLTNMIRGKEHCSLWEGSRALLLSIPPDGPMSTLHRSLGEKPWAAADPEACRGAPPGPTFSIDMPRPSADDLVLRPRGSRRGIRLSCPECQGAESQDLTPGGLLHHYLVEHSLLGRHKCEHCGLTCFDGEVLKFHRLLCFMDPVHLQQAFAYYQDFGHHVDGGEGCLFPTGEKRCYEIHNLKKHRKICGKSIAKRLDDQFCCICGLACSHRHDDIVRHQSSEPHKKQMAYENDPSTAGDLAPCKKCGILLGATPATNGLHEKFCKMKQMIRADPGRLKIVEDGAAARRDQDKMLKHFRAEAKGLAGPLMKVIAEHAPPGPLPGAGVCRVCLQKQSPTSIDKNKRRHEGLPIHTTAHKLLKRLYDDVPEDDKKPADRKRLAELLSGLQAVYHGGTALPPGLLDRLFKVHIPRDVSTEDFQKLVIKNKYLTATFPRQWKKSDPSTMLRILGVGPTQKPGKLDCVDCCLFGLHRSPGEAAISSHTSEINHLGAHGFIDGMLELMGPGKSRFDAVLEVQRRYRDSDSDPDSPRKPPRKKAKLAAASPRGKKATPKASFQANRPARNTRGRNKGKAATGKSVGVQAARPDIRAFFTTKPQPKAKQDQASREDDGGDGEGNGDLMDLDN